MKVVRNNRVSFAKRRCGEFRALLFNLQKENKALEFAELPPKKSTGADLPLKERKEILQNFLNVLLALKMNNNHLKLFLASENEVPIYQGKRKQSPAEKSKARIIAVPSNSPITNDIEHINEDLFEENLLNLEELKVNYTMKFDNPSSFFSSINRSGDKDNKSQIITREMENRLKKSTEIMVKKTKVDIEANKTELVDAINFTVKIKDMKFKDNKLVIYLIISLVIYNMHHVQSLPW